MNEVILVTGATGKQGGAVVDALIQHRTPFQLRALVRNPSSPQAKALIEKGVTVMQGDLGDAASLRSALSGTYGVFSVQTMMGVGTEGEKQQGLLLAELAAEAKVQHFVYSSVGGAERGSGVAHFESKWHIEQRIVSLGLPYTILRPVTFMDNFNQFAFRTIVLSMLRSVVPEERPLQLIAVRDIGQFAAFCFANREAFLGKAIEIAGDELTRVQIIETMKRAKISPLLSLRLPAWLRGRLPEGSNEMFEWFANDGFRADIPALRRTHPELLTLEQWLRR
jgi:uncharacterized protein YbjT (DUF2867 family)